MKYVLKYMFGYCKDTRHPMLGMSDEKGQVIVASQAVSRLIDFERSLQEH